MQSLARKKAGVPKRTCSRLTVTTSHRPSVILRTNALERLTDKLAFNTLRRGQQAIKLISVQLINYHLGVIGGQLFFWYCVTLGNVQTSRIVRRHAKPKLALQIPLELEESLVEREGMFFYGFVLTTCRVSGENRRSLYSVTAAAMYHGLSHMGVRILSAFGFAQPVTSLERARQKDLVTFEGTVRSKIHSFA